MDYKKLEKEIENLKSGNVSAFDYIYNAYTAEKAH